MRQRKFSGPHNANTVRAPTRRRLIRAPRASADCALTPPPPAVLVAPAPDGRTHQPNRRRISLANRSRERVKATDRTHQHGPQDARDVRAERGRVRRGGFLRRRRADVDVDLAGDRRRRRAAGERQHRVRLRDEEGVGCKQPGEPWPAAEEASSGVFYLPHVEG